MMRSCTCLVGVKKNTALKFDVSRILGLIVSQPFFIRVKVAFTKAGVQHVQGHLVAFLCSGDGHETLIAVLIGLIDLNDTATKLPDLIDLCTTLANDSSDHVVRNIDLLCKRLSKC